MLKLVRHVGRVAIDRCVEPLQDRSFRRIFGKLATAYNYCRTSRKPEDWQIFVEGQVLGSIERCQISKIDIDVEGQAVILSIE